MSLLATARPRHAAPRATPANGVRADIQGLRAIAVSLVLVYHLWPHSLKGGFVGVDVFFVISGFLITSHLLARPPAGARDLLGFWSRRARRLLPASLLVLLTTLVAARLVAPETTWAATAGQAKAAALYAVNWHLANSSVDYLALNSAATPVQHFWSLSVEEQFYLAWPVLILLLVAVARWRRWRVVPVVLAGLAVVAAASLAYSITETKTDPARAYFVTPTRIWELAVGGLLAGWLSRRAFGRNAENEAVPLPRRVRVGLAWAGLALIGWAAVTYTGSTPFPGWHAGVPVLGAAAVIAACAPNRVFALRPVRWLGDVSYSLYLWHWPLIALVPYVSGGRLGWLDKLTIVVVALMLAGLTKRFVEDRFRTERWGRPLVKPFALAAAGMALVVTVASAQTVEVHHRATLAAAAVDRALSSADPCLGAAALVAPAGRCQPATKSGTLTPTPAEAVREISDAWHPPKGVTTCLANIPVFVEHTCQFGDPNGKIRVALVGNSHAANWLPAVRQLAATYDWSLTTDLALGCALAYTDQSFPKPESRTSCTRWVNTATNSIIRAHYNLVVMSDHDWAPAVGAPGIAQREPLYEKGHTQVLRAFQAAHIRVVVIHDTPYATVDVPTCLETHASNYIACKGSPATWMRPDSLTAAAVKLHDPRITRVDMTRFFCGRWTCLAVVGRVPIYFDKSHLTAVYARTLSPYLGPALRAALVK